MACNGYNSNRIRFQTASACNMPSESKTLSDFQVNKAKENRMNPDQQNSGNNPTQPDAPAMKPYTAVQYTPDGRVISAPVVTMGEWALTMLVLMIPLVNLIMMFYWAFSSRTNPSKSNYFKVQLIFAAIIIAVYVVLMVTVLANMDPAQLNP